MQFENLADLWAMSGHGPFVWSAYAIALIVLIGIVWAPLARQRRFLAQQRLIARQIERRAQQTARPSAPSSTLSSR